MVFPTMFWILAVVSAVLCCIGFYRFVWFMSVGYGLAVAGCGAALLIAGLIGGNFSIPYLLLCVLLVIYGCRLSLFLLIREMKSAAYKKNAGCSDQACSRFCEGRHVADDGAAVPHAGFSGDVSAC